MVMSVWHSPVATIRTSTSSSRGVVELHLGHRERLALTLDDGGSGLHGANLERVLDLWSTGSGRTLGWDA